MKLRELFGVDVRSLAAFRIGLGALLLADLVSRVRFVSAHYTDEGLIPRAGPWAAARNAAAPLHSLGGSTGFELVLFALAGVFAVMLLAGYRTRLAAFASWLLLLSLHGRNNFVTNFGDDLLLMLAFWAMFLPLGARWSLDARRGGSAPPAQGLVVSVGSAALLLQLAFLYFFTGILKIELSDTWLDGTAVSYAVSYERTRALAVWMRQFPTFLEAITWGTLVLELLSPLLLFPPVKTLPIRYLTIAMLLGLQAGFGIALDVGMFPFISTLALVPFVPGDFWDRVLGAREAAGAFVSQGGWPRGERLAQGLAAVALAWTSLFSVMSVLEERDLPGPLVTTGQALGLNNEWAMYATIRRFDIRLDPVGTLADGSTLTLEGSGPGPEWEQEAAFRRAYRNRIYLYKLAALLPATNLHARYGARLCKNWNRDPAHPRLTTVSLMHETWRLLPDSKMAPPRRRPLLRVKCPPPESAN